MPERIQLRRTKGWRMPPDTVKVARPTMYGNPHRIGWCAICGTTHTLAECIEEFRAACESDEARQNIRDRLAGKNLACWCKPGEPCHADVLLELANNQVERQP